MISIHFSFYVLLLLLLWPTSKSFYALPQAMSNEKIKNKYKFHVDFPIMCKGDNRIINLPDGTKDIAVASQTNCDYEFSL